MLLTLAILVAAGGDTRDAVVGGANMGRDTDTIASLAGQFAGALNGIDDLPDAWLEALHASPGGRNLVTVGEELSALAEARMRREKQVAESVLAMAGG